VTPPACEFYAALAGKAQRCTRKVLWIADTGSGNHLSSPSQLESSTMSAMKACSDDMRLATANGQVSPEGELDVHLPELGLDARLLVLKSCPRVLSVGQLVEDHGLEFHWTQSIFPELKGAVFRVRSEELCSNDRIAGLRWTRKQSARSGDAGRGGCTYGACLLGKVRPMMRIRIPK